MKPMLMNSEFKSNKRSFQSYSNGMVQFAHLGDGVG